MMPIAIGMKHQKHRTCKTKIKTIFIRTYMRDTTYG